MKKTRIDRRIVEVIDQDEFVRRTNLSPDTSKILAEDTAIQAPNGLVYPVVKQYSDNVMGVYDAGPMIVYSTPEDCKNDPQYQSENIIDFDNISSLKELS